MKKSRPSSATLKKADPSEEGASSDAPSAADEDEEREVDPVDAEDATAEVVAEPALEDTTEDREDGGSQDGDWEGVEAPKGGTDDAAVSSSLERYDPMVAYQRELQRYPLLSPEETQSLAVRFTETQDPKVAAKLVTANLRLVVKIAYEYRRAYRNIMDLVQEGNIGLMQAVKRYDPYRGVKLSTYAALWIRAYIRRFILSNWRLVKLGTTQAQRKLFYNLRKKQAELLALGIDPSHAEVAKQLGVPEEDVAEMDQRLASADRSLDAPVGDAEGRVITRVDMMPSGDKPADEHLAGGEVEHILKDKLARFRETIDKEKELAIFDERLIADEPLTLQELGDRFGISRERVRQLEQRLTTRLRDYLRNEAGDLTEFPS